MLVLTRRKDESILINDDIEIIITDVRSGKVRVGIKAPENVTILRKELYDQSRAEPYVPVSDFVPPVAWTDVPVH